jgi:hypothetical protein
MNVDDGPPEIFWRISVAWILLASMIGTVYQAVWEPMRTDHDGFGMRIAEMLFFGTVFSAVGAVMLEALIFGLLAGILYVVFGSSSAAASEEDIEPEPLVADAGLRSGHDFIQDARVEARRLTLPVTAAVVIIAILIWLALTHHFVAVGGFA